MILQALARHYEDLTARNLIAPPGWNQVKVSYILGLDGKGNAERARACYDACKTLHEQLLSGVDTPAAKALLAFFHCWNPEQAVGHPALQDEISGIMAGANLIFRFEGAFIHEDPGIRQAWQTHYDADSGGPTMVCLVTGRETSVEAVHPAIKGVQGAQSSGAALVSFNAPAFCSYGKEQNLNAPTGNTPPLRIPRPLTIYWRIGITFIVLVTPRWSAGRRKIWNCSGKPSSICLSMTMLPVGARWRCGS